MIRSYNFMIISTLSVYEATEYEHEYRLMWSAVNSVDKTNSAYLLSVLCFI